MAIFTALAFGIPLTDEFGSKLKDIHPAVWNYAFVDQDEEYDDEDEDEEDEEDEEEDTDEKYKPGVLHVSTADDTSLVLGVYVDGDDPDQEEGLDLGNPEQVKSIHDAYLAVIHSLPEDVKQGLQNMARAPKLCVLRGPW